MATITKQEELLQELLKEYDDPADALKRGGLVDELKKRLIEKAIRAELDNHLGYAKHEKKCKQQRKLSQWNQQKNCP